MEMKEIVLQVIAQVANVEAAQLTPDTELVAHLGIDSPQALQILVELEDRLGIEISDEEAAGLQTVGHVLAALDAHEARGVA
ncbi:MAG: acyl carrier protein [Myxococcota bacterium]|nr:acyl carrier protein [Myxococcota bacterium]